MKKSNDWIEGEIVIIKKKYSTMSTSPKKLFKVFKNKKTGRFYVKNAFGDRTYNLNPSKRYSSFKTVPDSFFYKRVK